MQLPHPSSGFRCHGWEWGELSPALLILLMGNQKARADRTMAERKKRERVQLPGAVRGPDGLSSSALKVPKGRAGVHRQH